LLVLNVAGWNNPSKHSGIRRANRNGVAGRASNSVQPEELPTREKLKAETLKTEIGVQEW